MKHQLISPQLKSLLRIAILFVGLLFLYSPEASAQEKLFSFGVIADIQYGDKDGAVNRDYRGALLRLDSCVEGLNATDLAFVVQLGDIIDGYPTDSVRSASDLGLVLNRLAGLKAPLYHVVGNHCLNAGPSALKRLLNLTAFNYVFSPPGHNEWKFYVLDGNDAGYGAISEAQLRWLKIKLHSHFNDNRIVLFCHFPMLKQAGLNFNLARPDPLDEIFSKSKSIVAYIAGHDHNGGYFLKDGIHHITLKAMVEYPQQSTFAVFDVYDDKIIERGSGAEPDREMRVRK